MLRQGFQLHEFINFRHKTSKIFISIAMLVFIQQVNARFDQRSIEQQIGLGISEYLSGHPEILVGLQFDYPVSNHRPYVASDRSERVKNFR